MTALAVVGEKSNKTSTNNMDAWKHEIRPTIICGLNIRCRNTIESFNNQNNESIIIMDVDQQQTPETSCLYLVVYDFQYKKEYEDLEFAEPMEDNKNETEDLPKLFKWNEIANASCETPPNESLDDPCMEVKVKESEMEAYEAYNKLMKGMYQNLIPGESDEIFLPPSVVTPKQHSGPRALHVESSETDSAQAASLFTPHNLTFINSSTESGKSISDYITEIKNSKSNKNLNYSRAVQCISLPARFKNREDLEISDIIPTTDSRHVLVVLTSDTRNSVLLVYSLNFSQKMVKLNEEPLTVKELAVQEKPCEVSMLSQLERAGSGGCNTGASGESVSENGPEGIAILVCADGAVRIVDVSTLQVVSIAKCGSEKFVSAAYCNSKCPEINKSFK